MIGTVDRLVHLGGKYCQFALLGNIFLPADRHPRRKTAISSGNSYRMCFTATRFFLLRFIRRDLLFFLNLYRLRRPTFIPKKSKSVVKLNSNNKCDTHIGIDET